jgi:hypothetical protein
MKWLKDFFSTSNEINENTVMGLASFILLAVGFFVGVPDQALYIMAGLVAAFFGLGALKK